MVEGVDGITKTVLTSYRGERGRFVSAPTGKSVGKNILKSSTPSLASAISSLEGTMKILISSVGSLDSKIESLSKATERKEEKSSFSKDYGAAKSFLKMDVPSTRQLFNMAGNAILSFGYASIKSMIVSTIKATQKATPTQEKMAKSLSGLNQTVTDLFRYVKMQYQKDKLVDIENLRESTAKKSGDTLSPNSKYTLSDLRDMLFDMGPKASALGKLTGALTTAATAVGSGAGKIAAGIGAGIGGASILRGIGTTLMDAIGGKKSKARVSKSKGKTRAGAAKKSKISKKPKAAPKKKPKASIRRKPKTSLKSKGRAPSKLKSLGSRGKDLLKGVGSKSASAMRAGKTALSRIATGANIAALAGMVRGIVPAFAAILPTILPIAGIVAGLAIIGMELYQAQKLIRETSKLKAATIKDLGGRQKDQLQTFSEKNIGKTPADRAERDAEIDVLELHRKAAELEAKAKRSYWFDNKDMLKQAAEYRRQATAKAKILNQQKKKKAEILETTPHATPMIIHSSETSKFLNIIKKIQANQMQRVEKAHSTNVTVNTTPVTNTNISSGTTQIMAPTFYRDTDSDLVRYTKR